MSILIAIIIFSILIVIHEFGHFLAARQAGVKVEKFAIGFGPALVKIKGKETLFLICAFPLGGYVKLAGDARSECKGLKYEFLSKAAGIKMRVVFAGPLFNYLLALFLFWVIAFVGIPYQDAVIGGVLKDYPAYSSGLEEGDKILEVDGIKVENWRKASEAIHEAKGEVALKLERQGKDLAIDVPLREIEATDKFGRQKKVFSAGIFPYQKAIVGEVLEEYPASGAGLKKGDKILAVDGVKVGNWVSMSELIHKAKGQVALQIEREGKKISLDVPVKQEEITNEDGEKESISLIGIAPLVETKTKRYGFPGAIYKGTELLLDLTANVVRGFWYIIKGDVSFRKGATGPIGIFYITSKVVKLGIIYIFQLMVLLNVSLAIINLLPIPILDGGHIVFFFVEKLRRKPLSEKIEDIYTRIGFVILGALVIFVFFNDSVKYGPKIWKKIKFWGENNNSTKTPLIKEAE